MIDTANLVRPDTFPIAVARWRRHMNLQLHRHDNPELVIITGGGGQHRTRNGSYELKRGDVFIVPIDMAHGYERTEQLGLINVVYDLRRIELPLRRLVALPGYHALCSVEPRLRRHQDFSGHLHLDEHQLDTLLRIVDELEDELKNKAPGWEQAASGWLLQLLIRLARLYTSQQTPAARQTIRLGAVIAHISSHLDEDLDVDRLCAIAKMSRSTLQRGFSAAFGTSVTQYVIQQRIDTARDLLVNSDLPIADVARRVGIKDANYFSRMFAQVVGRTPRSFRGKKGV
jgi:AraC-like DNA-binding protein